MRLVHQIKVPTDNRILAFAPTEADDLGGFHDDALSVDDVLESIRHDREQEAQENRHNAR